MSATLSRIRGALGAGFLLACLGGGTAAAQTADDAVRAWISSLNASPDWAASVDSVGIDPGTGATVVTGLTITARGGPTSLSIDRLAIKDFSQNPGGGFAAGQIETQEAVVTAGAIRFVVDDVSLSGFSLPRPLGVAFDPERPYTSIVKMYGAAASATLDHARVGKVAMSQEIGGVSSRVNYAQLVIDHLAGGKIGELSSGPVTATSSMPQGTVDYTIDSFDAREMDLDAFDRVFDPDRYENGVGDGQWVDAMPLVTYGTIVTEMAGTRVTLASMTMEHLRLRQPPRPFAVMLDTLMAHPDTLMAHPDTPPSQAQAQAKQLVADHLIDLLSSMALGRIALTGIEVKAPGIDQLSVGDFHLQDLSIDGLDEIGVGAVRVVARPMADVSVDRFAFGGITFPAAAALRRAILGQGDTDPRVLAPHLGFTELLGAKATVAGAPSVTMEKGRVDFANYVGPIPTAISLALHGLEIVSSGNP